eukprot:2775817-Rhodomonas_salina.1
MVDGALGRDHRAQEEQQPHQGEGSAPHFCSKSRGDSKKQIENPLDRACRAVRDRLCSRRIPE